MLVTCILYCAAIFSTQAEEPKKRVWVDTDAACGSGLLRDIDDCLAIAIILSNPQWEVVGISTVFGNAPLKTTDRTVRRLVTNWCKNCVPVYRGARLPGDTQTPASKALSEALHGEALVVFILGPATNISAALQHLQAVHTQHKFVAVAGTRSLKTRLRVSKYSPFQLSDLNFASDPDAFEALLSHSPDVSLMPFELARQVLFGKTEIRKLATVHPKLAGQARRWRWVWRLFFGLNGFYPFDAVALTFLLPKQSGLVCSAGFATIEYKRRGFKGRHAILHVRTKNPINNVMYCHTLNTEVAEILLESMTMRDYRRHPGQ